MTLRQQVTAIAALPLAVLVLSGCGGSESKSASSGTVSSSAKLGANPLATRNGQDNSALPVTAHETANPPSGPSGAPPPGLNATPPGAKKRKAKPGKPKPRAGRVRGDVVYSDSGVNCNEANNQIWMEVNFPSQLPIVRGQGDKQRVAFTAWVRPWTGSSWGAWGQIQNTAGKPTWIFGTAYASNVLIIGGNGGNTIWAMGGQQATRWVSGYVPAGYYQWYTSTYFYANNHYEAGYAVHNNPNGVPGYCDFVS